MFAQSDRGVSLLIPLRFDCPTNALLSCTRRWHVREKGKAASDEAGGFAYGRHRGAKGISADNCPEIKQRGVASQLVLLTMSVVWRAERVRHRHSAVF